MVQRHSIILWRKAEKADKNSEEISKDAKKFSWIYENISRI